MCKITIHLLKEAGLELECWSINNLLQDCMYNIDTVSMPKISLLGMYQYWHFGDAANNIPPMKYFQSTDVDFLGKTMKVRLCELKKIMTSIDNEAASKGHPPREHMDTRQAATCYHHGEGVVIAAISAKTPCGRDRCVSKMKWTTVIKYMYKKRVRAT